MKLQGIQVLTSEGYRQEDVVIEQGVFRSFKLSKSGTSALKMIPGFFEIHTHGGHGYDFNSAKNLSEMEAILHFYFSNGVTSVLPTLLTDSDTVYRRQIPLLVELASRYPSIKGIHLEGPFLSKEYKGAQPESYLKNPSLSLFHDYQNLAHGLIRYLTLAPELPGSVDFIKALSQEGVVVSLGHSAASFDEASAAIKAGAKNFTHVMNAMKGIEQHTPSICAAAFYNNNCYNEVIMDGIHIAPEMVEFITKIKGSDKVIGITDSLMAAGLPDGDYFIGSTPIVVKQGDCLLKENGVRAGSTLREINGFLNFQKFTHRSASEASKVFSLNPAKLFSLDTTQGSLEEGKAADFVLLDGDNKVVSTFVNGQEVFSAQ
jgi:N-acetylglucosamine-6-phosphate deacetylase